MYPEFDAEGSEPLVVRKKPNDQHINSSPNLAPDGFTTWLQKTAALNMQWSQKRLTSCVRTV